MSEKERVTVDFDEESYYLDGEYWESWDNYGEEMADAINKEFNKLTDENEQLKQRIRELEIGENEIILKQETTINQLIKENNQLKTTIEELQAYDESNYIESEHINNIYKEFGFDGVIEEVKGRLVYGTVTEMDNLVRISTGGWSDDEALLDVLISPMTRFHYHYVGYLVGGAFYFDKDKSFESFMKIRLIKDLEKW